MVVYVNFDAETLLVYGVMTVLPDFLISVVTAGVLEKVIGKVTVSTTLDVYLIPHCNSGEEMLFIRMKRL